MRQSLVHKIKSPVGIVGEQNLLINGFFDDFTMSNDSFVFGLWVFDSVYRAAEDGGRAINKDLSGNGNDLTPVGFSADFSEELSGENPAYDGGEALLFDGSTKLFNVVSGNATDFNPGTDSFTVEFWAKTSTLGGERLFNKRAGSAGWELYYHSTTHDINVFYGDGVNAIWGGVGLGATNDGGWHHFAFVFDRPAGKVFSYLDGVYKGSRSTTSVTGSVTTNSDFNIGGGAGSYFPGQIANVRYSKVIRSLKEIKESYSLAKGWVWDGLGEIANSNFAQSVQGGGTVSQFVDGLSSAQVYYLDDGTAIYGVNSYTYNLVDVISDSVYLAPVKDYKVPAGMRLSASLANVNRRHKIDRQSLIHNIG